MKMTRAFIYLILINSLFSCSNNSNSDNSNNSNSESGTNKVTSISYSILNTYPHDTSSFTEGLEVYNNTLLESTGNYRKSKLVQTDIKTGNVIRQISLPDKFFGEGISVLHDTIYQMTYREHVVFVYSAKNFKKLNELSFNTEGWGMTNDGKNLIVSDGSSNLYFYEPGTFKLLHTQAVTENGSNVPNINELEYINGFIYANQWQYKDIIKINPSTGEVVGKIDLTDLVDKVPVKDPEDAVLNGIAYNSTNKKVYITGKWWPTIYEIDFGR